MRPAIAKKWVRRLPYFQSEGSRGIFEHSLEEIRRSYRFDVVALQVGYDMAPDLVPNRNGCAESAFAMTLLVDSRLHRPRPGLNARIDNRSGLPRALAQPLRMASRTS